MDKPEIDYPCTWEYRIIGTSENELRNATKELLNKEHTLKISKTKGRYISMNLELTVENEEERITIYEALRAHSSITIVL